MFTLRSQILAYKHLVRNIGVAGYDNFGMEGGLWEGEKAKLEERAGKDMSTQSPTSSTRPRRNKISNP